MFKFAVISFPGTNCETEAVRAFKRNGMDAEIVLWNDPGMLDYSRLPEFSGYCIAGGFSYEDRGRSGVIAAQDPITEILKKEADVGKIVLGICNGAQILVESGLIPGFDDKRLGMALAWNEMKKEEVIIDTGFYNAWAYLKNAVAKERTAFNNFEELLHIPFAHGEGRFMMDEELLKKLEENGQIVFKYCDELGHLDSHYPTTPNGAMAGAAAICNPAGTVMAIMPHPERDPMGNGNLIFQSIKKYLQTKPKISYQSLGKHTVKEMVKEKKKFDLELYIRLIITDNTERTIEEALIRKGLKLHLDRYEFYGINLKPGADLKETITKILHSGEMANFNKHLVYVKTSEGIFQYDLVKGLVSKGLNLDHGVLVADEKDFLGESKKNALKTHVDDAIDSVNSGVFWNFIDTSASEMEKAIDSKILYNPYSMILYR